MSYQTRKNLCDGYEEIMKRKILRIWRSIWEVQENTGNEPSAIDVKDHQMEVLDQIGLSGLTTK